MPYDSDIGMVNVKQYRASSLAADPPDETPAQGNIFSNLYIYKLFAPRQNPLICNPPLYIA